MLVGHTSQAGTVRGRPMKRCNHCIKAARIDRQENFPLIPSDSRTVLEINKEVLRTGGVGVGSLAEVH